LVSILPAALVWASIWSLAAITFRSDTYSPNPLIPVVGFNLIYFERKRIVSQPSSGRKIGSLFLLGGAACFVFGQLELSVTVRELLVFALTVLSKGSRPWRSQPLPVRQRGLSPRAPSSVWGVAFFAAELIPPALYLLLF